MLTLLHLLIPGPLLQVSGGAGGAEQRQRAAARDAPLGTRLHETRVPVLAEQAALGDRERPQVPGPGHVLVDVLSMPRYGRTVGIDPGRHSMPTALCAAIAVEWICNHRPALKSRTQ